MFPCLRQRPCQAKTRSTPHLVGSNSKILSVLEGESIAKYKRPIPTKWPRSLSSAYLPSANAWRNHRFRGKIIYGVIADPMFVTPGRGRPQGPKHRAGRYEHVMGPWRRALLDSAIELAAPRWVCRALRRQWLTFTAHEDCLWQGLLNLISSGAASLTS